MKLASTNNAGLTAKGWTVRPPQARTALLAELAELGPVIQTTEVTPRANAKAALATDREMQLHTDHPRARWISWECVRQSSEGGLQPAQGHASRRWIRLTAAERDEAPRISPFAHTSSFADDTGAYPILRAGR